MLLLSYCKHQRRPLPAGVEVLRQRMVCAVLAQAIFERRLSPRRRRSTLNVCATEANQRSGGVQMPLTNSAVQGQPAIRPPRV